MRAYLEERWRPAALTAALVGYALFVSFAGVGWASLALVAVAVAMLAKAPRWVTYGLVAGAFVVATVAGSRAARGRQDASSDRDEAVEVAARALLQRRNPWLAKTQLGNDISTGPASVLLAAPFVAISGRIDALTVAFWLLVAALLLAGDLLRRNNMFVPLMSVGIAGDFTVGVARHFSLEELSYGAPLMALAWLALERRRVAAAGALLALAVGVRLSYGYVALAFVAWWLVERTPSRRQRLELTAGAVAAGAVVVAALWWTLGAAFWSASPLHTALSKSTLLWPAGNALDDALNATLGRLPGATLAVARALLGAAAIIAAARKLRSAPHPFWHLAAAHLLAFTFVAPVSARLLPDYALPAILLAFFALAWDTIPD